MSDVTRHGRRTILAQGARLLGGTALAGALPSAGHADGVVWKEGFAGVPVKLPSGASKLYPDPSVWAFTYRPGVHWPALYGNGVNWFDANAECQTYLSPFITSVNGHDIPVELRYDPFAIEPDGLHIRAAELSAKQQEAYQCRPGRVFGSGMLLSRQTFLYGTFSLVAKLPAAKGSWPAFWLLADNEVWPPELDVFEAMPWLQHARQIHAGIKSVSAEQQTYGGWYNVPSSPTDGFHDYTLHWTEDQITITYDGRTLVSRPTPPSFRQKMYLIVNLAVGGTWPYNELGISPVNGTDDARLLRGSRMIAPDYPAEMVLRSLTYQPV